VGGGPPTLHVLFFVSQFPTQAEGIRGLVVLTLAKVRRTTEVEPKDLIVQIQPRSNRSETLSEINAALRVDLEVRI
jgi:hypothetical protein